MAWWVCCTLQGSVAILPPRRRRFRSIPNGRWAAGGLAHAVGSSPHLGSCRLLVYLLAKYRHYSYSSCSSKPPPTGPKQVFPRCAQCGRSTVARAPVGSAGNEVVPSWFGFGQGNRRMHRSLADPMAAPPPTSSTRYSHPALATASWLDTRASAGSWSLCALKVPT